MTPRFLSYSVALQWKC